MPSPTHRAPICTGLQRPVTQLSAKAEPRESTIFGLNIPRDAVYFYIVEHMRLP